MEKINDAKRALLMYSKKHFDPETRFESSASAGVIAKSLHETLVASGFSVDYLDPSEVDKVESEYDLFLGHLSNWLVAAKKSGASTKILFMPTTHPANRNRLMKARARAYDVPEEELLPVGGDVEKSFATADYVFQIGNEFAVQALAENGVDLNKIVHLHYGIRHLVSAGIPEKRDIHNYIHLASGLGLRKGLPCVMDTFRRKEYQNERITMLGTIYDGPNKGLWTGRLDAFLKDRPGSKYLGFVDSSSSRYREILDEQAWLFFPTAEEGEPGTVIESMSRGLVPIVTRQGSGIDFSVSGNFRATIEQELEAARRTDETGWSILSKKALRYVELVHDHAEWERRLTHVFSLIKAGRKGEIRYPKVSITLSVFNKEASIQELLSDLWKHTKSYPDWDLHIIYDGCVDKTREVARQALASFTVPVYESEAPNVFETKSNNMGLRASSGTYCVILQDDNFISEPDWLQKMISCMEQHPKIAVLGGLAGVNFFPLGAEGAGFNRTSFEVHKRIDWRQEQALFHGIHEVDAVMRGPIVLRKSLLEQHGYLDEAYAPFYDDDMDYCFRMKKLGYAVFYYPISVENRNLTIAAYDEKRKAFWEETMKSHSKILYGRWEAAMGKHEAYLTLPKPSHIEAGGVREKLQGKYRLIRATYHPDMKKELLRLANYALEKSPDRFIMFTVKHLKGVGAKIKRLGEKIFLHKFQKRTLPWHATQGDGTLRVKYDLNNDSVVFDIGGYSGQWSHEIAARYGSNIHIFEPIKKYADSIQALYKNNAKVTVNPFGLSNKNASVSMSDLGNSSSEFKSGGSEELVRMVSVSEYIRQHGISKIDLMKINIEGGEYDLLEHLLQEDMIKMIDNIQVQFHDFAPDAVQRMKEIQRQFRKTHELTYQYEFVWENWALKK